jgi:hypothetical protein
MKSPRWYEYLAEQDRRPHPVAPPVSQAHVSVTRVKTPMSPTFHLLMTLLTCGLWLLFLVPYAIIHALSPGRRVKTTYR